VVVQIKGVVTGLVGQAWHALVLSVVYIGGHKVVGSVTAVVGGVGVVVVVDGVGAKVVATGHSSDIH